MSKCPYGHPALVIGLQFFLFPSTQTSIPLPTPEPALSRSNSDIGFVNSVPGFLCTPEGDVFSGSIGSRHTSRWFSPGSLFIQCRYGITSSPVSVGKEKRAGGKRRKRETSGHEREGTRNREIIRMTGFNVARLFFRIISCMSLIERYLFGHSSRYSCSSC